MAYSPAVEKLLIEKHGFTKMDDGTIVSPQGTFKDDSGSYVKYTPPSQETSVQIGGGRAFMFHSLNLTSPFKCL